jgi:beta-glucosidase
MIDALSPGLRRLAVSALALVATLAHGCARRSENVKSTQAPSSQSPSAWLDRSLNPRARAKLLVAAMTPAERLTLLTGYLGAKVHWNEYQFDEARPQSAGFVEGVPRVGFPAQWQTDAGSGVATQGQAAPELERTLLPSGILTASTWNPPLAERAGAMIGSEARSSGFNVMLAGGVNLLRDPGCGRNFEYGGEDPLLAGTMVGALVRGIQSNRIVSTVKHFALNDQEIGRNVMNVQIDEAAARSSDLLAFQLAIELGDPGAVMCSYNLVNGVYACENPWLLDRVLKRDWGFNGYVMTDWGAQRETVANANAGLDQETGVQVKGKYQWLDKLEAAVASGKVTRARVDDMAERVAHALIAKGAVDEPVKPARIDFAAHAQLSREVAEDGIVLLKNAELLPLAPTLKRVALIGGHADVGVLSGGGSAQVYAPGGNAVPGLGPQRWPGPQVYAHSAPLAALRQELPSTDISWSDGADKAAAARAAAAAEVAIVVVTQWTAESLDFSLTLPDEQDALVEAVARANRRTIVVLETGGPVLLPWFERVGAVVEAWYPGSSGGAAIARVLSGAVNPSGHLPASFPRSIEQLPRPKIIGEGLPAEHRFDVPLREGAAVGYRWYDQQKLSPLLPFGYGLSYTRFTQDELTARLAGEELEVEFRVENSGERAGKHLAQVYVAPAAAVWEAPKRLAAFAKVELAKGAAQRCTVRVDPRLLATYDTARHAFHVSAGEYEVALATSAAATSSSVKIRLPERWLAAGAGAAGAQPPARFTPVCR